MAGVEKIIEKMLRQPSGIRFSEAEKVLEHYGYALVRKKGSHRHFRNSQGDVITVKEETPLKAAYIRDILARIGR
ncbi:type II toxin-antitoxin system HicA family toxin [Heliophilum fasciatum]|uniref:HicA-like toxin of HicAB toxin-antitoxin system n=1 Tax=Heliophilum fasciatum TaxID=35700 RepID=A0A4R2RIP5_9FIRM|nr:type II toxin-antitoxin system HicA family toxin [Heliophilum fasciatum]MCW2278584.1 putative RNA binding protein YcfA (HicA-like mRNA interferase family) [Heliophilum fasciatum]TCP62714.1 HicA-like toxin of HicAB toxin-antitoxin system [Heliophilum fasciatum]